MTLEDVQEAKEALEAARIPVSANTLLAKLGGSKRDVVKLLRQVRAAEERPKPQAEMVAPAPVPSHAVPLGHISVPPAYGVAPVGELAHFRARYRELSQAALGTADGSLEQCTLADVRREFAQRCLVAHQCLARARQLRPLVDREAAQAPNIASGIANAAGYAASLAAGTTPRARLLHSDMRMLTAFVGTEEAARLVTTTEVPTWRLY